MKEDEQDILKGHKLIQGSTTLLLEVHHPVVFYSNSNKAQESDVQNYGLSARFAYLDEHRDVQEKAKM